MKTIYLSPERRPAPHGKYAVGGVYEHDICCDIAALAKPLFEQNGFKVIIAPPQHTMAQRVAIANQNKVDIYMAIHTNAGGGTGTECLSASGNRFSESYKVNSCVYKRLTKLYPSKRGVKDYSQFYENRMTRMVSVYPEIAFHDNVRDAQFILNNKQSIAKALVMGVCDYYGLTYTEPTADKPITQPQQKTSNIYDFEINNLNDNNLAFLFNSKMINGETLKAFLDRQGYRYKVNKR